MMMMYDDNGGGVGKMMMMYDDNGGGVGKMMMMVVVK